MITFPPHADWWTKELTRINWIIKAPYYLYIYHEGAADDLQGSVLSSEAGSRDNAQTRSVDEVKV
jgi:hypothetical protein